MSRAMEFESFFKGLEAFSKSGLVKDGKMTLKSILGISTLWTNYPTEIRSVQPPAFLMRIFSFIGILMGMNLNKSL